MKILQIKKYHQSFFFLMWSMLACSQANEKNQMDLKNPFNQIENQIDMESIGSLQGQMDSSVVEQVNPMSLNSDFLGLKINEVVAKGSDVDWVEFYYMGPLNMLDISSFWISDDPMQLKKSQIAINGQSIKIVQNDFVTIDLTDELYGFKLGASDQLILSDPNGLIIDQVSWTDGQSPENGAYARIPDGIGNFQVLNLQSRNAQNAENAQNTEMNTKPEICDLNCLNLKKSKLKINEISARSTPDWVEIYYWGEDSIDLSGYRYSDRSDWTDQAVIPNGTVLNHNEFLYLEISDEICGFKIASDEAFFLYDDLGQIIDGYDWDELESQDSSVTLSRIPDGIGMFQETMPTPNEMN